MSGIVKKQIALSLPEQTDEKLKKNAEKYGMTKSGLVNYLVNMVDETGTIYLHN